MKKENPFKALRPPEFLWFLLVVMAVLLSGRGMAGGASIIGLAIMLWEFSYLSRTDLEQVGKLKRIGLILAAIMACLLLVLGMWA